MHFDDFLYLSVISYLNCIFEYFALLSLCLLLELTLTSFLLMLYLFGDLVPIPFI